MIDAVNSVNFSTKTYFQSKKNPDIAWERLTPSQIMEYAENGEDVPETIIKWAEEVNKLQNVPDDVTYTSVNGAVSQDEINEYLAAGEDADEEDAAEKTTMTQAPQFSRSMDISGGSKYEQGKTVSQKSTEAVASENSMEGQLDKDIEEAENIGADAEVKSENSEKQTSSMKQELDRLLEKAQSADENLSPADLNRIAELGGMLNAIGSKTQDELAQIGVQLSELETEIQNFEAIPSAATDSGTEAAAIGAKLMTGNYEQQNQFSAAAQNTDSADTEKSAAEPAKYNMLLTLYNKNYRMGADDAKNGKNALDAGTQGINILDDADSNINVQHSKVEGAQSVIEGNTGIEGTSILRANETNDEEKQTLSEQEVKEDESSEEIKTSSSKTEETDVKDSTLVIDNDELKKRRQKKGLA